MNEEYRRHCKKFKCFYPKMADIGLFILKYMRYLLVVGLL